MAVTENAYTGNGSTTNYSFTFPYLKSTDVQVQVDATVTTAWTFANATTVQFNTAPADGAKIKILRKTNVDNLTATFYAGSAIKSEDLNDNFTQNLYSTQETSNRAFETTGGTITGDINIGEDVIVKFEGATDNAHEITLTVADPTADRTIVLPNVSGNVVTTGDTGTVTSTMLADSTIATTDIANSAVTNAKLGADAVTGAKIADDTINSEHYVDGSIDTAHIADLQVTTVKIADDAITGAKIAANSVVQNNIVDGSVSTGKLPNGAVTTDKIAADAITGAKIADDVVDSEHLAADSIDTEHYAPGSVDATALSNNSVQTAKIVNSAVTTDKIADTNITTGKLADNAATTAKIATDAITTNKIATGAVTADEIGSNAVTTVKIINDAVTEAKILNASVTTNKIANSAVNANKLANDSVTSDKIADNAINNASMFSGAVVGTGQIVNDAITSAKIADGVIGSEHIAANAVGTSEIADAELTTLAGMQSGTASILASGTTLTATLAEINSVVDGKAPQTTITDDDTKYPTSGAVVDYVAAQIAPIGGLEVIATDAVFPNTQPVSGVVISIADAGGLVVNSSGTSTTGRTVGGSTVTINNIASNFNSSTVDAGVCFQVSSTGSGQIYNYHKATLKEADLLNLSNDINDFGNRYRVSAGEPSSNNDDGDLCWDTNADKMKVYDGTASAWKEVTSAGDFKYLVLTNAGTSNAATYGSATSYDLKENTVGGSAASVTSAAQLIVSINGVVQKPNTGTSAPSEGFAMSDSDTIIFSSAPEANSEVFVIQVGATTTIQTPADNTVSTAKIQNGAVTTAKIADNSVTSGKIPDLAIGTSEIAIGAVATNRLAVQDGNVDFNDSGKIRLGTGNDLQLYHDGTNSFIRNTTGYLELQAKASEAGINIVPDGTVKLYYDGSKKFETYSGGVIVTGTLNIPDGSSSDNRITLGSSGDLQIYHDGNHSYIDNHTGSLKIRGAAAGNILLEPRDAEPGVYVKTDNAVELYYDGSKKFETVSAGAQCIGQLIATTSFRGNDNVKLDLGDSQDLQIFHDGSNSYITNSTGIFLQRADDIRLQNSAGSEVMLDATANGAVNLYYDNSKKFETTSDGCTVTGYLNNNHLRNTVSGAQYVGNSTHGDLYLYVQDNTNNSIILQANTGEKYLEANMGGSVDLYHHGSKKLETITSGVRISSGDLELLDNTGSTGRLLLGNGGDLRIYHDGSHNRIDSTNGNIYLRHGTDNAIKTVPNGAVELYYDDTLKFGTDSAGVYARGDMMLNYADSYKIKLGAGNDLHIYHDGNNNHIWGTGDHGLIFSTNNTNRAFFRSNGNFVPWANNSYDLGEASLRWRNVYTNDLNLSNEGSANEVDGTWGNYTIQEGEDDLFLINRRNGKKYKFNLTEVN